MNNTHIAALCAGLITFNLCAVAANSPFHDAPASPQSLPADNLPPFRMLDDKGNLVPIPPMPPGAGMHRGAGVAARIHGAGTLAQSGHRRGARRSGRLRGCRISGGRIGHRLRGRSPSDADGGRVGR